MGHMRTTFIRHGRAQSNTVTAESRVGNTDAPLERQGVEQVKATAGWLATCYMPQFQDQPGHVFASPYRRTQETAEIIAERLGLDILFNVDLREIDKGDWTGRPVSEVMELEAAIDPEVKYRHRPPNGENNLDLGIRVANVVEDIHASGAVHALIVSHNHPIQCGIGKLTAAPIKEWDNAGLDYASVTALTRDGETGLWTPDHTTWNVKPYELPATA